MNYGFIKVASAVPSVKVADCKYNVEQIEQQIILAEGQGVEIIVFPELSLTGYTCQDLFRQNLLLETTESAMLMLLDFTRQLNIISIVGLPIAVGDLLLNCAAIIQKGQILGIVAKEYLPNYNEFYEKRWFASVQDLRTTELRFAGNQINLSFTPQIFVTCDGVRFGVEICEDVWAPTPPSNHLALAGADIIFNLSASDELIGKHDYLCKLLAQQSARTITGYVYSSAGFGESTQDVVYGGNALIFENGHLLQSGPRFAMTPQMQVAQIDVERLRTERRGNTTYVNAQRRMIGEDVIFKNAHSILPKDFVLERPVDAHPFIPSPDMMEKSCEEILSIQVMGLAKRLVHTGCQKVVLGISGGLDSTLALLVCSMTFDKLGLDSSGIIGVTMPGFGTTDRTYTNAIKLMQSLRITIREISIAKSVTQHFEDIGHDISVHDTTYENSQARERTQILMDVSNQEGGLVIGTGDLSELALGWCTYNGDHMSMYAVNASIPKTLIACLVKFVAGTMDADTSATLHDVVDTPISPELVPADEDGNIQQKTEDLVGPYELHDFFLYYFMRHGFRPMKIFLLAQKAFEGQYDDDVIKHWLKTFFRRFFSQQFKRSCLPDGPKVGSISLSPRGDWRMPSDSSSELWLRECEML
ncbi:NAD(+) synthase [Prevotella sp. P4-51]|uniref:NAD(+) synthase n=1 Tax=Prevotella sp. P4-51 TaxID=2024228 RepID=UPI000B9736F1|nr:NAD(+) synthase [Prevotella sp. P4-51]OYP77444.1 NAD(+) synthase [Prevotella sp. P4-51]